MKETDEFYFFWKHEFGQWTKRTIVDVNGDEYNCCEQFMMAHKAKLFNDSETLAQIMDSDSPKEQQHLGRQVKGFNSTVWDENKFKIVFGANFLKFTQHEDLKNRLLATHDKTLAEASPDDLIWGIGFEANAEEATQPEKWTGKNLLGEVLMAVRTHLQIYND